MSSQIQDAIANESNDESALAIVPYNSQDAKNSLAQQLQKQVEPTPDSATNDTGDDDPGGVIRRTNEFRSRLGPTMLESVAMAGMELSKSIERRSRDLYRNKFPLLTPRFTVKCEECDTEFDEDVDECEVCESTQLRDPDPEQRSDAAKFFREVNKEGQSLSELYQSLAEDSGRLGGWVHLVRYNYGVLNGEVMQEPTELVRADPKRVKPVVNEDGRIGGYWWACPIHRNKDRVRKEEYHNGHDTCDHCGADLREVFFAEVKSLGANGSDSIKNVFFEDEVIDYAAFNSRLSGHDWLSPVEQLWKRQAILAWMNSYAAAFFDDQNTDRYPGRLLILHTSNKNAVEKQLKEASDKREEDPYSNGVLYNELPRDGGGGGDDAQVIDLMSDDLMGQAPDLKDDFKSDIRSAYGQVDVQDSELEDAGGLNNEGLQLSVRDDYIASEHQSLKDGPLQKLMRVLGFDDWGISFVPADQPEEAPQPSDVVQAAATAEQAGIPYAIEDGRLRVADTDGVKEPEPETQPQGSEGEDTGAMFGDSRDDIDLGLARENIRAAIDELDGEAAADGVTFLEEAHEELFGPFERKFVDEEQLESQFINPTFHDDEDVPEFAEELVEDAAAGGAITKPEDLTEREFTILQNIVTDSLTQRQGWSINSIQKRMQGALPEVSVDKREEYTVNAVQDVINAAVELGYVIQGDLEDRRFYLAGPDHDTICPACETLLNETNPNFGGDPVPLDELRTMIQRENNQHFPDPDHDPQGGKIHVNCYHRISEHRDSRDANN